MNEDECKQTELDAVKQENTSLKMQILQLQKAFLMQQRELNALQMEKIDAMIAASNL